MTSWLGQFIVKVANLAEAEGRLARSGLIDLTLATLMLITACFFACLCLVLGLAGLWWSLSMVVSGAAATLWTSAVAAVVALVVFGAFALFRSSRL